MNSMLEIRREAMLTATTIASVRAPMSERSGPTFSPTP
jgi:hypothetical protein